MLMRSDEIILIAQSLPPPNEPQTDALGNAIVIETRSTVYGDTRSVISAESWAARQAKTTLALKATVYRVDYEGETHVEINGVEYYVERAYSPNPDDVELTLSTVRNPRGGIGE